MAGILEQVAVIETSWCLDGIFMSVENGKDSDQSVALLN